MEKLKEMVIKLAIAQKKQPLSSSQIALIDQLLHQEFPNGLRTPNHPTYASMINKAITELNEEDGSNETSISNYIKEQFEDLPWAHKSFLNHHLTKLCDEGLIVLNASKRYSIPLVKDTTFLVENQLVEVEVHGSGDEHLTSQCQIGVLLIENPAQKEKVTQEQNAVNDTELIVFPGKIGSLDIKRKKKEAKKKKTELVDPLKPRRYPTRKKRMVSCM